MTVEAGDVGDLLRWSESLAAIARTGLGFTSSLFERERFEEVLRVAADISAVAHDRSVPGRSAGETRDAALIVHEWLADVGEGVAGYVTPRVAIGAIVGDDAGRLLLVQRADSGFWLYPTGWADVGYSPAEVAVKEVFEETGILVEPKRLVLVLDGLRAGITSRPLYSLVFHCEVVGGSLAAHPLECSAVGWFARSELPSPLAGAERWVDIAFAAIEGNQLTVGFDPPRNPMWRGDPEGDRT